jgi:hypothetical protein
LFVAAWKRTLPSPAYVCAAHQYEKLHEILSITVTQLVEVVMDLGRPSMARFPEGDVGLSAVEITESDLLYATEQVIPTTSLFPQLHMQATVGQAY